MDKNVNIYFKVEGLDGYITDLDDLKKALGGVDKATQDAADATDQLAKSAENLEDLDTRLELTEGAVKSLAGGLEILAGAAGFLGMDDVPFFKELEENTIQIISFAQGAIDLTEGLGAIKRATVAADGAQKAFNATALLNPYVALATALVGLGVGIYKFIKASSEAKEEQARLNAEFAAGKIESDNLRKSYDEQITAIIETKRNQEELSYIQENISTLSTEELTNRQQSYKDALKESNSALDDAYFNMLQTRNEVKAGKQPMDNLKNAIEAYREAQSENNATVAFYNNLLQMLNGELSARASNEAAVSTAINQSAAYDDTIEQSISGQIRLYDELNSREIDRYRNTLEGRALDLYDAEQKYYEQLTLAGNNADLLAQVEEDYRLTKLAINAKYDALDTQQAQDTLDSIYLSTLSDRDRLETILMQSADNQVAILDQMLADKLISEQEYADMVYAINQRLMQDLEDLREKDTEDAKASNLEIAQASLEAASTLTSALQNLSDVNTEERLKGVEKGSEAEERILRQQFERNKKFQIAQAVITTAQSVMQALSSSPPPASYILAAANAAAGALQIAAIKRTTFDGGGDSSFTAPNPTASINYSFGQEAGPIIQPGQTSTGQSSAPVQTYVLASDVTNAQQAQQQIQNLARL